MTDIAVPAEAPAVDAVICTSGLLLIELVFVCKGGFFPCAGSGGVVRKAQLLQGRGDLV